MVILAILSKSCEKFSSLDFENNFCLIEINFSMIYSGKFAWVFSITLKYSLKFCSSFEIESFMSSIDDFDSMLLEKLASSLSILSKTGSRMELSGALTTTSFLSAKESSSSS